MKILETDRLELRWFNQDDAAFILKLVNDPAFLHYIGDKKVYDLDTACAYIKDRLMESYVVNGFGLNLVSLKESGILIGMCGLLNRKELEYVDIGYAFLPEYCGQGYAFEAASAMLEYGKTKRDIKKIVAITAIDNLRSARLLEKLGLKKRKTIKMNDTDSGTYYYS